VAANLLIGKQQPVLMGNDNFTAAPSGTFVTKDGYINIAANSRSSGKPSPICWGAGAEDRSALPGADSRKKNRKALTPLLEVKLKERRPPIGSSC